MARAHAASFMPTAIAHTFDHGCSDNSEQSRTLEGKALAIASAVAKPAPMNEGWRPTTSKRRFDARYGQPVLFTFGSASG